jgi:hypothetical protein
VAHLHRAGVRAQQVGRFLTAAFDVEGVVHGARGMVFGRVEGGEVVPVGLDLGALGHFEAHGAEDGLQALHGEAHGVQAAGAAGAAGQRHIERLGLQLLLKLGVGQGLAAGVERGFDGLFGQVDGGAAALLLVHAEGGHAFHQLGDAAGLAEETRLGVFQVGRGGGLGKGGLGTGDDGVQLVHVFLPVGCKGIGATQPARLRSPDRPAQ